jgi:30S ribosomal protein S31
VLRGTIRDIIAPGVQFSFRWQHSIGGRMGRGDKRTRKGKIFKGSYGKSRPHGPKKKAGTSSPKAAGRRSA